MPLQYSDGVFIVAVYPIKPGSQCFCVMPAVHPPMPLYPHVVVDEGWQGFAGHHAFSEKKLQHSSGA
jgi:hypothetical protein